MLETAENMVHNETGEFEGSRGVLRLAGIVLNFRFGPSSSNSHFQEKPFENRVEPGSIQS